jgi:hypothetical protein
MANNFFNRILNILKLMATLLLAMIMLAIVYWPILCIAIILTNLGFIIFWPLGLFLCCIFFIIFMIYIFIQIFR